MESHGLYCCATHEGELIMADDLRPLIDRMHPLGCAFTVLGGSAPEYRNNAEGFLKLIDMFNRKYRTLLDAGIRLGYHNHHFEFKRLNGLEKISLEEFYDRTDFQVCAELDVHWVARGDGNPETWIRKVAGRMPLIHFKDFTIMENDEPYYCEIGEGNLDWPGILKACQDTGVRWYSIEQDNPFPDRDIFDSMKISFDNLKSMGVN